VHLVPDLAIFGALEWMASAYVGLRATGMIQLTRLGDAPHEVSGRIGPWLHFLPYRRVDLGLFFEGGITALDLASTSRSASPIVAGGGFLDVYVTSYVFVHSQLEITWSRFFSGAAWLGAGVAL
jgi:hypothetical protein